MYEDWTEVLRADAHAEVDRIRRRQGKPPWKWRDPTPGRSAKQIAEAIKMSLENGERLCACGCGGSFVPPKGRDQRYRHGHKPKTGQPIQKRPAPTEDAAAEAYRAALRHGQAELKLLDARIETCDDEMQKIREKSIAPHQKIKDAAVERHELLSTILDGLSALLICHHNADTVLS